MNFMQEDQENVFKNSGL